MTLFTLYCLLLMVALPLQAHMSCYYPDGTYQPTDRPCNSNGTEESFCCGPGVTCLSDKVCDNFGYVRGSCTDQSFKSSACPNFCLTPGNAAVWMFQCGDATDSYCCSPDGSPCSCETGNITLAASLSDVSSTGFIPSSVSTTTSDTHTVPSLATTIIEISSARTTISVEVPTLSLSSSALPSATVVSSDPSSSSQDGSKEGVAIGAPIAILSVVIILLVSVLIRRDRRTQSTMPTFFSRLLNSTSPADLPVRQEHSVWPPDTTATKMDGQVERPELANGEEAWEVPQTSSNLDSRYH